jgi:hypothetical protein
MFDPTIPQPLRDKVDRELESGERIEWIGMPKRVYFTPTSTAAFSFGIPWTAFSLFWIASAAGFKIPQVNQAWDLFPLLGIPFVLIGCGMLSAPIWAYRTAGKSVYVITDRRAITFIGGWSTTIRSFSPEKHTDIYRKEKADGSGDVIVSRRTWRDSESGQQVEEFGFLRVENAKDVERRLKTLAEQYDARQPRIAAYRDDQGS